MKGTPDLLNRLMGNNQELKTHAWNGFSLLHLAACCGNLATMSMLVRLGTYVDEGSYGRSRHDLFPPGTVNHDDVFSILGQIKSRIIITSLQNFCCAQRLVFWASCLKAN